MKYRHKAIFEAEKWDGTNFTEVAKLAKLATKSAIAISGSDIALISQGKVGESIKPGVYLVCDDQGHLTTIDAAHFEATFEPVRKPRADESAA